MDEKRANEIVKRNPNCHKVKSFNTPGKFYVVTHTGRTWNCGCDFQMYHPGRKCRHIAHVLKVCRRPGCPEKSVARDLCRDHYNVWYRKTHKRVIKAGQQRYYREHPRKEISEQYKKKCKNSGSGIIKTGYPTFFGAVFLPSETAPNNERGEYAENKNC